MGTPRIGRYEVLDLLNSTNVYLARATGLGGFERLVAIKTLDQDDDERVAMFLDEARLLGALHHERLTPIYEVGRDDEGRYYFVMEFVAGETIDTIWKICAARRRAVPLALALGVGTAVADVLAYIHEARAADGTPFEIVHRNVAPSNILVGRDGAVKLLDFGIAKAANRTTPIGGRAAIDRRTDIFALGLVLYELTTMTAVERITRGDIVLPSHVVARYPLDLERIVMRALAVDPDDRYQDAGTLARDLEVCATRERLPLGHAAIASAMTEIFHDAPRRRRADTDTDVSPLVVEADPTSDTAIVTELGDDTPTRPITRRV